jgi:hypothetical protein
MTDMRLEVLLCGCGGHGEGDVNEEGVSSFALSSLSYWRMFVRRVRYNLRVFFLEAQLCLDLRLKLVRIT